MKSQIKQMLANMPLVAELDFQLRRRGNPPAGFTLKRLEPLLADWRHQAETNTRDVVRENHVFIFAVLPYWIEQTTALSLALSGMGYKVTLGYLPYGNWRDDLPAFDVQQHDLYAKEVLAKASPQLNILSLLDQKTVALPPTLAEEVAEVCARDCQYTLVSDRYDESSPLYALRHRRNTQAAGAALQWLQVNQPDAVIIPNAMIFELGAVNAAARHLDLPVFSYEYGEQRDKTWVSLNNSVMLQDTSELWTKVRDQPFTDEQQKAIEELYAHRRGGLTFNNFYRTWQNAPTQGDDAVRKELGLDPNKPLVLMATNVLGDSLTLGRELFSGSMTNWILRTIKYFGEHGKAQLVVRVHPGEQMMEGRSITDLIRDEFETIPDNVFLIEAGDKANTYDLISIADFGMAYTTTTGMEMAMNGLPVVSVGRTHYRGKGFTHDPNSWEEYFELLKIALADVDTMKLTEEQMRLAWKYAYHFFFDYPKPYPWHIMHFWEQIETWPISYVLSDEGQAQFGETFKIMAGEELNPT